MKKEEENFMRPKLTYANVLDYTRYEESALQDK